MSFFLKKNLGLRLNFVQALELAYSQSELGLELATPNPCVGSVILDSKSALVGLGHHEKFGEAHAEVNAFSSLDLSQSDADNPLLTVFVTLEPCAHEGKTPSCAKALASKQVERVIYLVKDPNELVSGQGHKILELAGIKTYCIEDLLEKQELDQPDEVLEQIYKNRSALKKIIKKYKNLNRHFFHSMTQDLPYITLKWAQTLDGSLGLTDKRLMVTNKDVQKEVHHLRACHDIILIGANTVIADNPKLTNRFGSSKNKINTVAILDLDLKLLNENMHLNLFQVHKPEHIIFITQPKAETKNFHKKGFKFIKVDFQEGTDQLLNLEQALRLIKKEFKINSVFIEGGVSILTSLLEAKLFNEIYVFLAPRLSLNKKSIRLSYLKWLKFVFLNLIRLKFSLFEDNLLVQLSKNKV